MSNPLCILVVDDEESIRRTYHEWLVGAYPNEIIRVAADAGAALAVAAAEPVDLAILDFNLGAGIDGLQVLKGLSSFHPDIVAVLITAYAQKATPLDALRMGVRDYLEKNQDLTRSRFLEVIDRLLKQIRPAKQQRQLAADLLAFRETLSRVLPLMTTTAAMRDPLPLPRSTAAFLAWLRQITGANEAVLLIRQTGDDGEIYRVHDAQGALLTGQLVPFGQSLAALALSQAEPTVGDASGLVTLQPFEQGRANMLAVPLPVGPSVAVVAELFDKPGAFTAEDRRNCAAAAAFGCELFRHSLSERQAQQMLQAAIETALGASARMTTMICPDLAVSPTELRLAQAVRTLASRHGEPALGHCLRWMESLTQMLDAVTGVGE